MFLEREPKNILMIEVANFSPFQRQMPMMHDNKGMLALERHRASPPSTLTPLQPVSQEMYTSVIRKTYDASSAVPVSAIESSTGQHNRLVFFFFLLRCMVTKPVVGDE